MARLGKLSVSDLGGRVIRILNRAVVLAATLGIGALVPRVFGFEDVAAYAGAIVFLFALLYGSIALTIQLCRERSGRL
jgi:hypothetical protein